MNDFRIKVFLSVARHLSFTKASKELFISQPAISKHISEIESLYGIQLFLRANNKISLTKEGELFYKYAEEISLKYRELAYEVSQLTSNNRGKLSIGASTTIAQYILPSIISKYKQQHPHIELSLISGNTEYIESLIDSHIVDLGIVEGVTHKREFHYSLFTKDELVLITTTTQESRDTITIEEAKHLPIALREDGSGTLEVIKKSLGTHGVRLSDLNIIMRLGSSEAIKRFVLAGDSYAIISIAAVVDELRRGELCIVEIEGLDLNREFSFITNSGSQDRFVEDFMLFCRDAYNI